MTKKVLFIFLAIAFFCPLAGCGETPVQLEKVTVDEVEITRQPFVKGNTIILRLFAESGKHTLISLGATQDEIRIVDMGVKKGDVITIGFQGARQGHGNIVIKYVINHTLNRTFQ